MGKIYNNTTNIFDFGLFRIIPNMSFDNLKLKDVDVEYKKTYKYDNGGFWVAINAFLYGEYKYQLVLSFGNDCVLEYFDIYLFDKNFVYNPYNPKEFSEAEKNDHIKRIIKWLDSEHIESNDVIIFEPQPKIGRWPDFVPKIRISYKWYVDKRKSEQKQREINYKRHHPIETFLDKLFFHNSK